MNDFFAVAAAPATAGTAMPLAPAGEQADASGEFAECLAGTLVQDLAADGQATEGAPDGNTEGSPPEGGSEGSIDADPASVAAAQSALLGLIATAEGQSAMPGSEIGAQTALTDDQTAQLNGQTKPGDAQAITGDDQAAISGANGTTAAVFGAAQPLAASSDTPNQAPAAKTSEIISSAAPAVAAGEVVVNEVVTDPVRTEDVVPRHTAQAAAKGMDLEKPGGMSAALEALRLAQAVESGSPGPRTAETKAPLGQLVSEIAVAMDPSASRPGLSNGQPDSGNAQTAQPRLSTEGQMKAHVSIEQQFAAQMDQVRATVETAAPRLNAAAPTVEAPVNAAVTVAVSDTQVSTPPAPATGPSAPPVNSQATAVQTAAPVPSAPALPFSVANHAGLKGEAMRLVGQLKAAGKGASEATLLLHPKNLGSVHVRMELIGDKISASMMVETRGAEQAMQAALPHLDQAFRAQGFNEVRMLVSSGNPEYSWSQQAGSGNGQMGTHSGRNGSASQLKEIALASAELQSSQAAQPALGSGRLNIVV